MNTYLVFYTQHNRYLSITVDADCFGNAEKNALELVGKDAYIAIIELQEI
jgi:hypothetical protein